MDINISALLVNGLILILAGLAGIIALLQLYNLNKTSKKQLFSSLLNEISSDEAFYDRGLVFGIGQDELAKIPSYIKKGQEAQIRIRKATLNSSEKLELDDEAVKGIAIERTIARLDRVSYYFMGNKNKPEDQPPLWLETMVCDTYKIVGDWIKTKRTPGKQLSPHYAEYLVKLCEYYNSKSKNNDVEGGK